MSGKHTTQSIKKNIEDDLKASNKVVERELIRLMTKYNLTGLEFVMTNAKPNYIGINIDVNSDAFSLLS